MTDDVLTDQLDDDLPEPTHPSPREISNLCPGCSVELHYCVAWDAEENDYEGIACPNQCDLEEYYG